MSPFEFIIALVHGPHTLPNSRNAELEKTVQQLTERVKVLEGIVTDSGYQLGHQIERLRDKENVL
ncbi:hypothetical protein GRI89_03115 [Altererythrobacter salegens]|uniref:Uncharacterized protein n=1 Tax=Croceibacterium salegens TaxID=1737568 RepID=A0A6I4SRP3_9SPHN|nr:hypothetical protein [Croceibacterium salegens]MXO58533.1 hypothetical protein [Croceibacterium salegens]